MAINNPCPRASPSDSGSLWTINPWLPRFIYYINHGSQGFMAINNPCPRASPSDSGSLSTINPGYRGLSITPKTRYSCTMASWVQRLYHPRVNGVLPRAKPEEVHHYRALRNPCNTTLKCVKRNVQTIPYMERRQGYSLSC